MSDTIGAKLKKTAEEIAGRLGEAAQTAGERIGEMREKERLSQQIRQLQREKERCRGTIADLVIRMFDQNTFAEALLHPEYARVKEIDVELAKLEQEREDVGHPATPASPASPTTDAE